MPLVRKKKPKGDPHWDYVYSVTREFADDWSNAFVASTDELKAGVGAAMYAKAVETGEPALVIGTLPFDSAAAAQTAGWQPLIESVYARAGKAEVGRLGLSMSFNLQNPYALQWIPQHAAKLVTEVGEETKAAIRAVILEGYQYGTPPLRTGIRIREMVGLTTRDANAVMKYWRSLTEEADLSATRVDELADSYSRRLLRRRAENIARTETITAAVRGTQDSWATARDAGLVAPESMQEWIAATESGRTCPICMALDGKKAKLGGAFDGGFSGPPAHPSCRCTVGLVTEIPD